MMKWTCALCGGEQWKRGLDGDGVTYEVCVRCSTRGERPTSPPPASWPTLDAEREEPTLPAVPHPRVKDDSVPPTVRSARRGVPPGVSPKKNG